ncbi:MAG: restriction endonuclease subunit S [Anaerolineae bacterium]
MKTVHNYQDVVSASATRPIDELANSPFYSVTGEAPHYWRLVNLGQVLREVDSRAGTNGIVENDDVVVLSLTKNQGLIPQSERFEKRIATSDISNYKVLRRDQIVYNPFVLWEGAVHILRNRDCGLVSPVYLTWEVKSADPQYIDYLLRSKSLIDTYQRLASGVVQRRRAVRKDIFTSIIIALPPLLEQQAIARALQTVQQAKEAHQRELNLERERKAALMEQLFTHGTRGESTKQTEIGEIPESWQVVPLEEIVTLQRGRDLPVQDRRNGAVPVIGSNGVVGLHDVPAENIPVPGIATGRSGSIGLLTYMSQPYWPLNTVLYGSDFHGNNPLFVFYWLHLFDFKKYSQGVSVPTLNRNLVHPIPFPLPMLDEQLEIAEVLRNCDEKIAAFQREIELTEELFSAMLEELMTGRLSVAPLIEGRLIHE